MREDLGLRLCEGEGEAVANDDADIVAKPLPRRSPHGVGTQRIRNQGDAGHLQREGAGVHPRSFPAQASPLEEDGAHALAGAEERDGRAMNTAADHAEVEGVAPVHRGAGSGTGMSL